MGDKYASTTVVSPRDTSFIKGLTWCEADTWLKPASLAAAATAFSFSENR